MQNISPFHLAIPVHDLSIARDFYENKLGLRTGRTSDQWADYDFFGHQLVVHEDTEFKGHKHFNEVDGKSCETTLVRIAGEAQDTSKVYLHLEWLWYRYSRSFVV